MLNNLKIEIMKTIEKKMTRILAIGVGAFLITFNTACSKDNPLNPLGGCSGNASWVERVSKEANDYSNAISAYNSNPTDENCSKAKAAAKNYLDSLRDVLQCVPTANRAEINKAINEAKAEVDEEGCD